MQMAKAQDRGIVIMIAGTIRTRIRSNLHHPERNRRHRSHPSFQTGPNPFIYILIITVCLIPAGNQQAEKQAA